MNRKIAALLVLLPVGVIALPTQALAVPESIALAEGNQSTLIAQRYDRNGDGRTSDRERQEQYRRQRQEQARQEQIRRERERQEQSRRNDSRRNESRRVWIPGHWESGFLGIGRVWVEGQWQTR